MYSDEEIIDLYNSYVVLGRQFWARYEAEPSDMNDNIIIADLTDVYEPIMIGNLVIAKYIQIMTSSRIIGLIEDQSFLNRWTSLLNSFGVKNVVYARYDMHNEPLGELYDKFDVLRNAEGEQFRELLAGIRHNDIPIGRLIYNSYLAKTGEPTINLFDDIFHSIVKDACQLEKSFSNIFNNDKIIATVQGSSNCILSALLLYAAKKKGRNIYLLNSENEDLTFKKISSISTDITLADRFDVSDFNHISKYKPNSAKAYAYDHLSGIMPGLQGNFKFPESLKQKAIDALCGLTGADRTKPFVYILCPLFSDMPCLEDDHIFYDQYSWLNETLGIISGIKDVNWIVRRNPYDRILESNRIDFDNLFNEKTKEYPHIYLCPEPCDISLIAKTASAVVSPGGENALLFTMTGVTSVAARKRVFPVDGMLIEASSRESYDEILRNIADISPLTKMQVDNAAYAFYLWHHISGIKCLFIPPKPKSRLLPFDIASFFKDAFFAIRNYELREDDFFENFEVFFNRDHQYLKKNDILETDDIDIYEKDKAELPPSEPMKPADNVKTNEEAIADASENKAGHLKKEDNSPDILDQIKNTLKARIKPYPPAFILSPFVKISNAVALTLGKHSDIFFPGSIFYKDRISAEGNERFIEQYPFTEDLFHKHKNRINSLYDFYYEFNMLMKNNGIHRIYTGVCFPGTDISLISNSNKGKRIVLLGALSSWILENRLIMNDTSHPYLVLKCVNFVRYCLKTFLLPDCLFVKMADIVMEPKKKISDMCSYLNLDFQGEMDDGFSDINAGYSEAVDWFDQMTKENAGMFLESDIFGNTVRKEMLVDLVEMFRPYYEDPAKIQNTEGVLTDLFKLEGLENSFIMYSSLEMPK